jgi:predicted amidohydrolase YtcJ
MATGEVDTVFVDAQLWVDGESVRGALAVTDGRIVALGADGSASGDEAAALAGQAGEVVDAAGGLLLPAFGEGHAHPIFGGLELQGPAVRAQTTVEGIAAEVGRWAAEHPDDEWVLGASYDPSLSPDGGFDAAVLDAVVPDRPVLLRAADYHTIWCNSEALRRAGVDKDTPDPRLGYIDRLPDGSPRGTLREWHACDLMFDIVPARGLEAQVQALADACRAMNRVGITWMQDAWVDDGDEEPYLELAARGGLTVRSNLAFRADPDRWRAQLDDFPQRRKRIEDAGFDDLVTARTVKFFADGVIENGTAAVLDPYVGTCEHGMRVWEPAALTEAVTAYDALGFQVHIHAIGDEGIRSALDAIAAARDTNPEWDRRPVLTHVQLVHPDDLPRFAELGVVANFQAYWAQRDGLMDVLTVPRIGEERASLQYPMARLLRGTADSPGRAVLSMGSDWPVSTNAPLEIIRVAVTRETVAGEPAGGWLPEQRLTLAEAIEMGTYGCAVQAFAEDRRGRLAVGNQADLVLLDRDLAALAPADYLTTGVVGTWLAGARVH